MSGEDSARIAEIQLDSASIVRWNREVEHERQVAIFDLKERNFFRLVNGFAGPYHVLLSLREANLIFAVSDRQGRARPRSRSRRGLSGASSRTIS